MMANATVLLSRKSAW